MPFDIKLRFITFQFTHLLSICFFYFPFQFGGDGSLYCDRHFRVVGRTITVEILVDLSCLLSLLYSAVSFFDTPDLLCNFLLLKRVLFDVLVFFYLCCVSFLLFLTQLLYFLIILLIILCFSSVATSHWAQFFGSFFSVISTFGLQRAGYHERMPPPVI